MTAIDRIRAKFWDQMPARIAKLEALLEDARKGEAASTEALASLIHTAKGEAQLLNLEPCAALLEAADRMLKATRGPSGLPRPSIDALADVRAALAELVQAPAGGAATRSAFTSLESALGGRGLEHA